MFFRTFALTDLILVLEYQVFWGSNLQYAIVEKEKGQNIKGLSVNVEGGRG